MFFFRAGYQTQNSRRWQHSFCKDFCLWHKPGFVLPPFSAALTPDFGCVGGAPNKINLYVGKTPVKFNIPEAEAADRLVDLIREHNKWVEPEQTAAPNAVSQNS
jgi:hypothetical protein